MKIILKFIVVFNVFFIASCLQKEPLLTTYNIKIEQQDSLVHYINKWQKQVQLITAVEEELKTKGKADWDSIEVNYNFQYLPLDSLLSNMLTLNTVSGFVEKNTRDTILLINTNIFLQKIVLDTFETWTIKYANYQIRNIERIDVAFTTTPNYRLNSYNQFHSSFYSYIDISNKWGSVGGTLLIPQIRLNTQNDIMKLIHTFNADMEDKDLERIFQTEYSIINQPPQFSNGKSTIAIKDL